MPFCIEMTAPIRHLSRLFAGEVLLDHVGQSANILSLDVHRDGRITLRDLPTQSVTDVYNGAKP